MPKSKKVSAKKTKKGAVVKNSATKASAKKPVPTKPVKKIESEDEREIILPPVSEDKILDDGEVPVVEAVEADLLIEESDDEESDLDTFGDNWEE